MSDRTGGGGGEPTKIYRTYTDQTDLSLHRHDAVLTKRAVPSIIFVTVMIYAAVRLGLRASVAPVR